MSLRCDITRFGPSIITAEIECYSASHKNIRLLCRISFHGRYNRRNSEVLLQRYDSNTIY